MINVYFGIDSGVNTSLGNGDNNSRPGGIVGFGLPNGSLAGKPTMYGALTTGFTYEPSLPAPVSALLIRPEVRYDCGLNGSRPFNGGRDDGAFTFAADIVLGF